MHCREIGITKYGEIGISNLLATVEKLVITYACNGPNLRCATPSPVTHKQHVKAFAAMDINGTDKQRFQGC
jgi:hypothetical protein